MRRSTAVFLGFVLAMPAAACGGSAASPDTTVGSTTTMSLPATTTSTQPPTTTSSSATTTTTTRPPTTTTSVVLTQEHYDVLAVLGFETTLRETVISILEGFGDIQSVDLVAMDGTSGPLALVIDVTSKYSTTEYRNDSAWEIARTFATLWEPDGIWKVVQGLHNLGPSAIWPDDIVWPGLRLTVSGIEWACEDETMRALADVRLSRGDWEIACSP